MKMLGFVGAVIVTIGGASLLCASPAGAHHAFSTEFDANQPITLKGTITKVEWINPHAWIHLDVPRDGGVVEKWMVEAGSPNTLVRRGMTRDSIPAAPKAAAFANRHRTGPTPPNGAAVPLPAAGRRSLPPP